MKLCCTAMLMVLLVGCGTASRVVRLDTGGTAAPLVFTPRSNVEPVALDADEFEEAVTKLARDARPPTRPQEAARRLFEMDARSGSYTYETRSLHITPLGPGEHLEGETPALDVELTRAYLRWCERTGRPGDCLRLLTECPTVNGDGRFALALALAKGAVLDEMLEAFKDLTNPHAMVAAALWTWTTYMVLISLPDVTVSKGLAAVMTATLIAYVGVDTFWGLIVGFRRLMDEADRATTFNGLREAGERYGKVMGRNAARAFAMLAMAAIGNTAPGLAAKIPALPGSGPASLVAAGQGGFRLIAVGHVETVAVSGGSITIALAPGALAATAQGMSASPVDSEGHEHHIASNKFSTSTRSGGPWTPRYQEIFDRAGMSLNDPANKVRIPGHKGPHPREYHEEVYDRLQRATSRCRSMEQCRGALLAELQRLGQQLSTSGTRLNKLVTQSE